MFRANVWNAGTGAPAGAVDSKHMCMISPTKLRGNYNYILCNRPARYVVPYFQLLGSSSDHAVTSSMLHAINCFAYVLRR